MKNDAGTNGENPQRMIVRQSELIICTTCGGASGSLIARMGFVVSHPSQKREGWGIHNCWKVKVSKNFGCATRLMARIVLEYWHLLDATGGTIPADRPSKTPHSYMVRGLDRGPEDRS